MGGQTWATNRRNMALFHIFTFEIQISLPCQQMCAKGLRGPLTAYCSGRYYINS